MSLRSAGTAALHLLQEAVPVDNRTAAGYTCHMNRFPICLLYVLLLLLPLSVLATEEYARETGRVCSVCHVDPAGGGELSPAGREYAASLAVQAGSPAHSVPARIIRFGVGYLHLITAFLWFGTILYVHLVLKPAYASSGLPRGEMRVGIVSMVIMGVTGIILTKFRVGSPEMLLQSRFGVLLLVKIGLYLVMVVSAAVVILVIGPRLRQKRHDDPVAPRVTDGDLTVDELARCDGREGRPALFAFDGSIYDATGSRLWKQGSHMGRHQAGGDLTEVLSQAPHGVEVLTRLTIVGRLTAAGTPSAPLHVKVFFFMAYMNLAIVFLVVLILALWRWW